jgi:hypothetical protein
MREPRRDPSKTYAGLDGTADALPSKAQPAKEHFKPISIYLNKAAMAKVKNIINTRGVNRHALLQYAITYFLAEYDKDPNILQFEQQIKKL